MGGDIMDIPRTVYKKAAQTGLDRCSCFYS